MSFNSMKTLAFACNEIKYGPPPPKKNTKKQTKNKQLNKTKLNKTKTVKDV